jgi:hypothetical protein
MFEYIDNDDDVRFFKPIRLVIYFFYSVSSLKQQYPGRHVALFYPDSEPTSTYQF